MKVLAREQEELIARAKEERDAIISDANLTRRQIVSQAREEALAESERLMEKDGPEAGGAAYNERTPQAGTATNAQGKVQTAKLMMMLHSWMYMGQCTMRLTA